MDPYVPARRAATVLAPQARDPQSRHVAGAHHSMRLANVEASAGPLSPVHPEAMPTEHMGEGLSHGKDEARALTQVHTGSGAWGMAGEGRGIPEGNVIAVEHDERGWAEIRSYGVRAVVAAVVLLPDSQGQVIRCAACCHQNPPDAVHSRGAIRSRREGAPSV